MRRDVKGDANVLSHIFHVLPCASAEDNVSCNDHLLTGL